VTDIHVGLGLWNMRATARRSSAFPALYDAAIADAVAAERLGFDSLWFGEHRFWYDGWCPQPLLVAAAAASATTRLHLGTAMLLLPQHDPRGIRQTMRTLQQFHGDRIELGVSLGYRPEEYAGVGLSMRARVRLMNQALDTLGEEPSPVRTWVGGMAVPAIQRAARRGLSLMLPPTLPLRKVRSLIDMARQEAAAHDTEVPRIGILKDTWIDKDANAARQFYVPRLSSHYTEYVTAWWARDEAGVVDRSRVAPQVERNVAAALVGRADDVAEQLLELVDAGVDTVVLQFCTEETRRHGREQMEELAADLLPLLRSAS
jgi:alkanesulfonate monooxygenase SsuD/methylene tetrahydromethanopterin reductase-like flavin-dependent oxidoreductase (luciferase family)